MPLIRSSNAHDIDEYIMFKMLSIASVCICEMATVLH